MVVGVGPPAEWSARRCASPVHVGREFVTPSGRPGGRRTVHWTGFRLCALSSAAVNNVAARSRFICDF